MHSRRNSWAPDGSVRRSSCAGSSQLAHAKGWRAGTPSALMNGTRSPGSRNPKGRAAQPHVAPLNPSVAEAQEAPSRSQLAGRQRRLEAKPALKASGGLAVTGIVWLHLTHIHPPASLFSRRTSGRLTSETRSGGRGAVGRGGGRPGSTGFSKRRRVLYRQERGLTWATDPVAQRHG